MATIDFDRDSMAKWYAQEHRKVDPGLVEVHYLPENADPREIRLVEVNKLIAARNDDAIEPIDFGVDRGMESAHRLVVLDVTPDQWERIQAGDFALPKDWTLDNAIDFRA